MLVHMLSTACDVISCNGQGQLCPPTCAEQTDLSNHTRMSTIRSRTPEKKAKKKKHVTLTWKFQWKSCSISHLPFLSSNPKILKAFLKTFAIKIKPPKCPPREKNNEARKKKKEGRIERKRKRKRKVKVKTAVSQNFALCACPNFEFASSHFASGSEGCEV